MIRSIVATLFLLLPTVSPAAQQVHADAIAPVPLPDPGPGTGDTTAPETIDDLGLAGLGSSSIELSWTAPGDDTSNLVAVYDLRYSTSAIVDLPSFNAATPAVGEPAPAPALTAQGMTVDGLAPETTYRFCLRSRDAAGNWSALSNVVPATTSAAAVAPTPSATPAPTSVEETGDGSGADGCGASAPVAGGPAILLPTILLAISRKRNS